MNKLQVAVAI